MPLGNSFAILKSSKSRNIIVENYINIFDPNFMVFDSNDNLFVTCSGGNWINKIDPNGVMTTFVHVITGRATPYINGMAIDSFDNLYTTDITQRVAAGLAKFHYNIYKINPSGQMSTHISNLGSTAAIAIDKDDNMFVSLYTDAAKNYWPINKFTSSKIRTENFGQTNTAYAGLIAIHPNQDIYFATAGSNRTIYRVPKNGSNYVHHVGGFAQGPSSICFDDSGNIYAVDGNSVWKFSNKLESLAGVGSAPGGDVVGDPKLARFRFIRSVAYRKGVIYVADKNNNKIKKIIL